MCDYNVITAAVQLVANAAQIGFKVYSNIQEKKVIQRQYEYQQQVAEQNKKIAQNNAAMERQTGLEEARRQRIKTLQAIGRQQSVLAANGVDISSPTALDIIEDTSMLGELDALTIQYNAEKNARNYDTQSLNFHNDAILSRYAGENAKRASKINTVSSVIGGLGSLAGSFKDSNFSNFNNTKNTSLGYGLGSNSEISKAINNQTGFSDLYALNL